MRISYLFISILLAILCIKPAWSQGNCEDALYKSNSLYKDGNINEAIEILEPCISAIKNKDDLFEAYRMLAIAYHDMKEEAQTSKYIRKMLVLRPDYQDYPNNDPSEFTRAVKRFTVTPQIYAGIELGMNWNQIQLVQSYSAFDYPQTYPTTTGYLFGIYGAYMFMPAWTAEFHLSVMGTSTKHNTILEGSWEQNYSEQMQFINPQVGISKNLPLKEHLTVYAGLNAGISIMQTARVYILSGYGKNSTNEQFTRSALDDNNRVQPNFGLFVGTEYAVHKSKIGIRAGYNYYNRTTINDKKRYNDAAFIFDAQYVTDDVKLSLFSLNLTLSYPLVYSVKH